MKWQDRITLDPNILVGKPVIKGTRIAVEFVLELMSNDWAESDILRNFPHLKHEDLKACLAYAVDTLKSEKVFPIQTLAAA
jgi:uncharacterized protein (DUF433 family)